MMRLSFVFVVRCIGVLLVLLFLFASVAWAKQITVAKDGSGDYRSIQAAIDSARSGDTVYVKAGIYEEHIVLKPDVEIEGSGPDVTVIDGGKTSTVVKGAKGATVRGVTITNSGPEHECSGIQCYDCTMTIADNVIVECTNGISLWRSSSYIVNNTITRCGNNRQQYLDYAIICNRSTPYIANNLVVDNLECGIYICWEESNGAR